MMMMILHPKLLFITYYDTFVMAARMVLILKDKDDHQKYAAKNVMLENRIRAYVFIHYYKFI